MTTTIEKNRGKALAPMASSVLMIDMATLDTPTQDIYCPEAIRDLNAWLVWRSELLPGEKKPRKVPKYARSGVNRSAHGTPDDVAQLVTFDEAMAAYKAGRYSGIGFATLKQFGVTIVDYDGCVSGAGIHPAVLAQVDGTYTELSPSRTGIHAIFIGDTPSRKDHDTSVHGFGMEVFGNSGFVTFTGDNINMLEDTPVAPITPAFRQAVETRFARKERDITAGDTSDAIDISPEELKAALFRLDADMPYTDWLKIGMALHAQFGGGPDGLAMWDEWSATAEASYSGLDHLESKWESFARAEGQLVTARTILHLASELDDGPNFSVEDIASMFDVIPTDDAKTTEPETKDKPPAFEYVSFADFRQRPRPVWLVKGVLPLADLVVIYGESGSGKTFFTLDLAYHIAAGIDWRGHRTSQGNVVYLCAEGVGGFRNRVDGLAIAKQTSELPITVIPASPDLMTIDDTARLFRTLAEIHAKTPISLIIVDTMAQVMPGADENSGKDVGKVLKNLRNLADVVKAPVMLVAHTGKDLSRGERGWSGLRAAADARIEVSRDGDYRCAKIVKQKDGEDGAEYPFKLDTVDLGEDDDGDLITSCVVRHVDTGDKPAPRKLVAKLGGNEKLLNDLIIEQLTINDFATADEGASAPLPWVQWAAVLTAMQSRHPGKTSRPWRDAWKSLSNRPGLGYRIDVELDRVERAL